MIMNIFNNFKQANNLIIIIKMNKLKNKKLQTT